MSHDFNFELVNQAALEAYPTLLQKWFPAGALVGREFRVGDLDGTPSSRGKGHGSLSINVQTGVWADFATGASGGDPVSLNAARHEIGQLAAAKNLAIELGLNFSKGELGANGLRRSRLGSIPQVSNSCSQDGTGSPDQKTFEGTETRNPKRAALSLAAQRIWNECRPINSDGLVSAYLAQRGCSLPHMDGDLREHPELLHHPTNTHWPAMVGLISDAITMAPISLHMTFLSRDGIGKAPVEPTRLYLANHRKSGGVVRLWPDSEVTLGLAIAEGVESALTAARAFQPVWAVLDAGNLGTFPVLEGIEALTIVADHDSAGLAAAERCADRWAEADRDVRIWTAESRGQDLNDWARLG